MTSTESFLARARWPRPRLLALAVLLALLPASVSGETFVARVIGVTDGDTLTVLRGGRPDVIRLRGIDAPERGQSYGDRARQHAAALAFGQLVAVEATERDRYGRLLGEVRLPDGRSLNQELVRAGSAWWFRRYSADLTLARLEVDARLARRGLWADPRPTPPWDYRRDRGSHRRFRTGAGRAGRLRFDGLTPPAGTDAARPPRPRRLTHDGSRSPRRRHRSPFSGAAGDASGALPCRPPAGLPALAGARYGSGGDRGGAGRGDGGPRNAPSTSF